MTYSMEDLASLATKDEIPTPAFDELLLRTTSNEMAEFLQRAAGSYLARVICAEQRGLSYEELRSYSYRSFPKRRDARIFLTVIMRVVEDARQKLAQRVTR
jgi:hypothetical protein